MISMNFEYNSYPAASNFPYHVLHLQFFSSPLPANSHPFLYYFRLQFDKKDYWFS